MDETNETVQEQTQENLPDTTTEESTATLLQSLEGDTEQAPSTQEDETEEKVEKNTSTGLSEDDLVKIVSRLAPVAPKVEAAPQPKQYTPEELKKLLNVFDPDDAFMARLADPNTAKAAIAELVAGQNKHFQTVLQLEREAMLAQIREDFGPIREQAERQKQQAAAVEFYKEFTDLAKFTKETDMVTAALMQQGAFKGKDLTAIKQLIAGETRNLVKRLGGSASPSQGSGTSQQQTGQRPKPAALSSGSQGGAGKGGGPAPTGTSAVLKNLGL